ncbi:TetR/AcrR family transcriptional regulator [Propioniciclava coleopterorum]|uniref:TetR/AcrR family transcriptional regulator n=1 Tax=Propioniciclava coleopterorum TaxID=2714937 RepID=A0A6G7Y7E1_9ACTN|nr:TetR/AcrR family transcriptional regulator [Propioniciclava coleopterorum]QIK72629.1 TetR/AcrR family transcriptional regulator [Propioniciclava coleopterorum]
MSRTPADDPRYRRVRQQLIAALLDLAATRPAETITVAELATAAGVSRATFYAHGASPAALLAETLVAELRPRLDALAEQMSHAGADYVGLWRQIYQGLLEHVRDHRAVYEVITSQESTVSGALTNYFEEASSRYVHAMTALLTGPPVPPLWTAMAISQQAHSMVAVIHAWIVTGMTDPPEDVVEVYLTLAPPWQLARPDADGSITLRRSRSATGRRKALPAAPERAGPEPD